MAARELNLTAEINTLQDQALQDLQSGAGTSSIGTLTSLTERLSERRIIPALQSNEDIPKKPDGTPVDPPTVNSSVPVSTAERVTGQKEETAKDDLQNGNSTATAGTQGKVNVAGGSASINVVPNPLLQYASYSPMWTMACLTKEQFNKPELYRDNDSALTGIIFSSGGRFESGRAQTDSGTPEYYVNNFQMLSVIAASPKTGNTNAVKFSFDVIEPYSMGLLLQSMQVAAQKNKYANYLDNAPYLLKLDFKGYDEKMNEIKIVKSKYFVMKLVSVKFEVNESGSIYKVEGVPYNHSAYGDLYNITYKDLKLTGDTVKDACDNLTKILNDNEDELVKQKRIDQPDRYVIDFPTKGYKSGIFKKSKEEETSGTKDVNSPQKIVIDKSKPAATEQLDLDSNDIGAAPFGFNSSSGGTFGFGFERDKIDEKTGKVIRDRITIDPSKREFLFAQSQSLTDIITQLIISSKYAKDALDPKKMTADGFIRWFKLDVQMQFLEFDEAIGDFAKKIIFRVVPYLVHHSIFSNPNSVPFGYQELEKKIAKKYNYIYTGDNVDILRFDIQINNLFYTGTSPSPEGESASVSVQDQQGPAPEPAKQTETQKGQAPQAQLSSLGRSRAFRDPSKLQKENKGGSGTAETTEKKVAEAFHKAFITGSSADLITVDLEILGDTYWLVDSGLTNHFSEASESTNQITEDGSANYEGSDVFIFITFRNPQDVNPVTGLYQWPYRGKVSPFTGIYRVVQVESQFQDGFFKQRLKCIRMPLQAIDLEGLIPAKTDKDSVLAIDVGEKKPQPSSLNETASPPVEYSPRIKPQPSPEIVEFPSLGARISTALNRGVNSLGSSNAPEYTGDDNIIRARLGLPLVPETNNSNNSLET